MHKPATTPRFRRAFFGRLALAAIALSLATGALAQEEGEDDDLSFEQKIIKGLLGGMGVDTGRAGIDYRERSPLVIPPAMNLPSPEETNAAAHPAWPKDADIQERRKARADNRVRPKTVTELQDPGRPLSPQELQQGRAAGRQRVTEPGQAGPRSESEIGRPLSPSELGYTGGIFNSLFGSTKTEEAQFKGEPERRTLTQPPPGYQTPSPSQPYGVGPDRSAGWKIPTFWDRGTTSN